MLRNSEDLRSQRRAGIGAAIVVLCLAVTFLIAVVYGPARWNQGINEALRSRFARPVFLSTLVLVFTLQNYWQLRKSRYSGQCSRHFQ
jgi:hypothetical protein